MYWVLIPTVQTDVELHRSNQWLFGDGKTRGENLRGYLISVHEGGQALYVGDNDSEEKRGIFSPLSQNDGYIVEVPHST